MEIHKILFFYVIMVYGDFDEFGYWTSTEYDEGNVWYINFWSGMITKNSKASAYCVRSVIQF